MTKCLLIKCDQESVHHYMVVVPPFLTYLSVPYLSSSTWQGVMMKYAKKMSAWVVCERIKGVILISGLDSGKQSPNMDLHVVLHLLFTLLPAQCVPENGYKHLRCWRCYKFRN